VAANDVCQNQVATGDCPGGCGNFHSPPGSVVTGLPSGPYWVLGEVPSNVLAHVDVKGKLFFSAEQQLNISNISNTAQEVEENFMRARARLSAESESRQAQRDLRIARYDAPPPLSGPPPLQLTLEAPQDQAEQGAPRAEEKRKRKRPLPSEDSSSCDDDELFVRMQEAQRRKKAKKARKAERHAGPKEELPSKPSA
jgi:hypothetical protein